MRTSTPLGLFVALATAACGSSGDGVGDGVVPCAEGTLQRRFPIAGFSIVEGVGQAPEVVTLNPNASLVDGNTAVGAGVNLGYGAGDSGFRDLGVQLADPVTSIDELHVWVDRTLPPAASSYHSWSAFLSDDNVSWTAIPLVAPVKLGVTAARFEIPIGRTAARYLKVVTRPLASGITSDPALETVLATEVQAFAVAPPCATSAGVP
jgi:hypothetical protein